jgi:hypothetical protein
VGLRRGCEPNVSIIDGDYKANRQQVQLALSVNYLSFVCSFL